MAATQTEPAVETVTVNVDGRAVEVPRTTPNWQGNPEPTTVLQACKHAGIEIPPAIAECASCMWACRVAPAPMVSLR